MPEDKKNVKKRNESEDTSDVKEGDSSLQSFPKRRELYEEGLNDRQIADGVGVSPATIRGWRYRRGLPANQKHSLSEEEESKRRELYEEGLNDDEIAEKVGTTEKAIRTWRRERGLDSNREGGVDSREVLKLTGDGWSSEYKSVDKLLNHAGRRTKSENTRKVYCSVLARFCDRLGMTPDQVVEMGKDRLEEMLREFLDRFAKPTAKSYKYHFKTFLKTNGRDDINYPRYETVVRVPYEDEYVPYLKEAIKMMNRAGTLKRRAIIGVLFTAGLRPSTLRAVRYGVDAEISKLRISTIKEEIESGAENLLINVFPSMKDWVNPACKNKVPYYTFTAEFVTEAVRDYLEERKEEHGPISDEEFLFPSGDNSLPWEKRVLKPLAGGTINTMVKRAAKKARIEDWRIVKAKSLRKVFNNALKDCREVPDEDKEWLMGHVIRGSREAYYDSSKVGKTRGKYAKVSFSPENRSGREEFLRKLASFHGLSYDEVMEEARQVLGGRVGEEKAEEYLKRRIDEEKKSKKDQEIIEEGKLQEYLDEGWDFESKLSDGKVIVSRERNIWDMVKGREKGEASPS